MRSEGWKYGRPTDTVLLNARVKAAARRRGRIRQESGLNPNRILRARSQRTRETLARILPYQPREAQDHVQSDIEDQGDLRNTSSIRLHGGRAQQLLIIGHNPATEQTAIELAGTGEAEALADLRIKYPTGAISVFDFDITDWADLQTGTGHLERFIKPRDLSSTTAE